jgi:hypothetical protein
VTPEELKQWGEDLLAAQRKQFEESLPDLLTKHAPHIAQEQSVTYDFDADPEGAVKAILKNSIAELQTKFSQQLSGLTEQVKRVAQQNDLQANQFMQAIVPGAVPNEAFDKTPSGFGSLTWGQARKMFEQGNDLEGLKQYAEASKASANSIPANQEVTASKARASSPNQQTTTSSQSEIDNDLMAVMQGRMTEDTYQKKYGVKP